MGGEEGKEEKEGEGNREREREGKITYEDT